MNRKILTRYIFGKSTEKEMRSVEKWLEADPENMTLFRHFYFSQQAFFDLQLMDSIDTEEALIRLKTTVYKKKKKEKNQYKLLIIRRVAAALLIPLLILAGYFLPRSESKDLPHLVEVTTNPGVISVFDLPDSTKVWLNAGSKLVYPSDFNQRNRWVRLSGEGFFKVKKRKNPFEVKIDSAYSIKVLGTTFNVQAYADDDFIKTSLINGRVQLNYLSTNNLEETRCLREKETSFYSKELRNMKIEKSDIDVNIAWKSGRIFFDNHTLKQAIRILRRHYNVEFKVLNESIYKSAITGKFDNEQLPQVLNYIKEATGIKYKIKKPALTSEGKSQCEVILFK